MKARYYDPDLGRFLTADSIVQAPFDPQTLNRFAYVRNNPIKYTDPSGHSFGFKRTWRAIEKESARTSAFRHFGHWWDANVGGKIKDFCEQNHCEGESEYQQPFGGGDDSDSGSENGDRGGSGENGEQIRRPEYTLMVDVTEEISKNPVARAGVGQLAEIGAGGIDFSVLAGMAGASRRAYAASWEAAGDALSDASTILGVAGGAAAGIGWATGMPMVGAVANLGIAALGTGVGSAAAYTRSGYLGSAAGYGKAVLSLIGSGLDLGVGALSGIGIKAASYGQAFSSTRTGYYIKAAYGYASVVAQSVLGFVYGEATDKK